jgi:hydroxymethylbilane synthase
LTRLRIGTRGSALALAQTGQIAALLEANGVATELIVIRTSGDRLADVSLAKIGGKGLFIKELEVAIAEGRADIAVHSMKDVPSDMPPGMILAAMLTRADPHDAFVSLRHESFSSLPQGARVGTSSLRRQCQLKYARPDLQLLTLRGNVETRLRKLQEDQYDAIVLAAAGLIRLGLEDRITHRFDLEQFVPAVGQGIIGIECRADDSRSIQLVRALNDTLAWQCCEAERAFALRLQGSCQSPIAGHAQIEGGKVHLRGVIGSPDGQEIYRGVHDGTVADVQAVGTALADRLLDAGARALLEKLRLSQP